MGNPLTRKYAETRARWEPLYEVTQIKGDGEAHKFLSSNDEFAGYEIWDKGNLDMSELKEPEMLQYEYARQGLDGGGPEAELEGDFPVREEVGPPRQFRARRGRSARCLRDASVSDDDQPARKPGGATTGRGSGQRARGRMAAPQARPLGGGPCGSPSGDQVIRGFRTVSAGNRPKSRSTVHNSRMPWSWQSAATCASCTWGPWIRPSRSALRSIGQ